MLRSSSPSCRARPGPHGPSSRGSRRAAVVGSAWAIKLQSKIRKELIWCVHFCPASTQVLHTPPFTDRASPPSARSPLPTSASSLSHHTEPRRRLRSLRTPFTRLPFLSHLLSHHPTRAPNFGGRDLRGLDHSGRGPDNEGGSTQWIWFCGAVG